MYLVVHMDVPSSCDDNYACIDNNVLSLYLKILAHAYPASPAKFMHDITIIIFGIYRQDGSVQLICMFGSYMYK